MMCCFRLWLNFGGMEDLNVFTIAAAIADPLRLSVMMYLIRDKASVSELINHLDVSQSNLSNHLAILKKAGLIKSTSLGRQKIYELANADVAQLIELLLNLQPVSSKKEKLIKPIQFARTCYDHLAGRLGVAIFDALLQNGAITYIGTTKNEMKLSREEIEPGPNAEVTFGKLGVEISALTSRRKFAFGCLDWTEKTPHLAGALGAALCKTFFDNKWIVRKDATRTIALTPDGKKALKDLIGLDTDHLN